MNGILVVGHGSRSSEAYEVFMRVVREYEKRMDAMVEGCFMELSLPNIPDTIDKMYLAGVREIIVVPYFLFAGIHIKEDIPGILKDILVRYKDLSLQMAKPIGYQEKIVDILQESTKGELTCI